MSNEQQSKRIRITVDEAKRLYDEEDVIVLDVVDTDMYDEVSYKIKDAIRIAPEDFKDEYAQLPKDKHVLAYCT